MNQAPQPVDLSKLKGILSNAKAVMNKVDENHSKGPSMPSTTTQSTNYITEEQFNAANSVSQSRSLIANDASKLSADGFICFPFNVL